MTSLFEDPDQIRSFFTPVIFSRGQAYFNEGRIIDFQYQSDRIVAKVQGGERDYRVSLWIKNGTIRNLLCTCPYDDHCKHEAAVLIYFAEFYLKKTPGLTNKTVPENMVIRLDSIDKIPPVFMDKFLIRVEPEMDEGRWITSLAVIFEDRYIGRLFPLITLVQQKVKNEKKGKVEFYRPGRITEIADPVIYSQVNELVYESQMRTDIKRFLPALIQQKIPVFIRPEKSFLSAEYLKVEKIKAEFRIDTRFFSPENPAFKPAFFLNTGDESGLIPVNELNSYPVRSGRYLVFFSGSSICYLESGIRELEILFVLLTQTASFKKEEVLYLKDFFQLEMPDLVECDFALKEIRVERVSPVLCVEMDHVSDFFKKRETLSVRFFAEYSHLRVNIHDQIQFLSKESDTKEEVIHIFERDRMEEQNRINRLNSIINPVILDRPVYHSIDKSGYMADLLLDIPFSEFIRDYAGILMDEGFDLSIRTSKSKIKRSRGSVKVKVKTETDWLEVSPVVEEMKDGKTIEAPAEIDPELIYKGLVKAGNDLFILKPDDIRLLTKLLHHQESGHPAKISRYYFQLIQELKDHLAEPEAAVDEAVKILKSLSSDLQELPQLPENLQCTLRDYQKAGYYWLYQLRRLGLNGCLADDMGLGKTVQTLSLLQKLKEEGNLTTSILIAPVTLLCNWENEVARFTPTLKTIRHYGSKRDRELKNYDQFDLILVSYQTLRNDIGLFENFEFDYCILDEAHAIKNASSDTFQSVRKIRSAHRLSLTGTPVENHTMELWAQFHFLIPSLLGSKSQFKKDFANGIEHDRDPELMRILREMIKPFLLRRKKEEVAKDLPEKEEIIHWCEMEADQIRLYETVKDSYRTDLLQRIDENGIEKSAISIFEALLKLRQAVLLPSLIDSSYQNISAVKFNACMEMLEEILTEDHKVLIFSQFIGVLKQFEVNFRENGIQYSYLDGSTGDRQGEIERFQKDAGQRVFLISLKAGGVGINLTEADYVFIFDPWWNPAVENQAIDRAHRIGQKRKVTVYRYIVKNTVEEKILDLHDRKKELARELISEDRGIIRTLSRKDIEDLFS